MALPTSTATVASGINRSMQSPRSTNLSVRLSNGDGEGSDRVLPVAMAHGHGRRLIQMLFRSNNDDDLRHTQRGDDAMVVTSPISIPSDSRSEDDVPVGSNKLRALKRKLFPSRKRRHPMRIPPLVVSPIATGPPFTSLRSNNSREGGEEEEENEELTRKRSSRLAAGEEEIDPSFMETRLTARDAELEDDDANDNDDEDFDDDLVDAIEAADRLQSVTSDETLMQMSRAIEELHEWKTQHELATQSALKAMDDKLERELAAAKNTPEDNADELAMCSEAEVLTVITLEYRWRFSSKTGVQRNSQRNQQLAEAARTRLAHTLKESEQSLASERPPSKQIAQVLLEAEQQQSLTANYASQADAGVSVLAKLREEVFDLGVKALSSSIHATLLQELNDADNALDLKFADVEKWEHVEVAMEWRGLVELLAISRCIALNRMHKVSFGDVSLLNDASSWTGTRRSAVLNDVSAPGGRAPHSAPHIHKYNYTVPISTMSSSANTATADLPMERRYRLVELQKEELKVQTKIDDFQQWGAPALDQAGYHKKEATQRATAHSQRGSIFWALVERTPTHADGVFGHDDDVRDDEIVTGTTAILCHCESHAFDCTFRKSSGEIVRGLSHNIGSVFTLPAHRGKALARFFLMGVQRRMETLPDSIGSALYSDIGPTYYDSLGWRLYESTHAKLKLSAPRNASVVATESTATLTTLLLDDKLDELLARDNARVENEMAGAMYDGKEVFATRPSRDSVEWQFCIGVVYANIRGFPFPPTHTGVHLDDDAFVVWCHNLKESTLYIVHARFPVDRPAATVQLLRAAIVEARTFRLESIAVWDPSEALFHPEVASALEIVKEEREDSLSSLLVFNKHRGDPLGSGDVPVWLNNEKLAWV